MYFNFFYLVVKEGEKTYTSVLENEVMINWKWKWDSEALRPKTLVAKFIHKVIEVGEKLYLSCSSYEKITSKKSTGKNNEKVSVNNISCPKYNRQGMKPPQIAQQYWGLVKAWWPFRQAIEWGAKSKNWSSWWLMLWHRVLTVL